jgi:hypothetical protein
MLTLNKGVLPAVLGRLQLGLQCQRLEALDEEVPGEDALLRHDRVQQVYPVDYQGPVENARVELGDQALKNALKLAISLKI